MACLGNMRNLAAAHVADTLDHNGLFADVGLPHGGPALDEAEAWFHTLAPYYATAPVLHSPLDDSVHWPADQGGTGTPVPGSTDRLRRTSYGWNNYLSRKFTPATAVDGVVTDRLVKIRSATNTVHFLCMATTGSFAGADHVHVENWDSGTGVPPPAAIAASQMQTDLVSGKPKSGDARSDMSFVDGHVESRRFADVYVTFELNCFDPMSAGLMLARASASGAP